jgi:hypothetical protein
MSPTIINQAKLAGIALAAGLALTAFGTGAALAASGSERDCEAAGGTYTKVGSDAICVFPEESVANENANPDNNGQTTQDTETGQGNISPKEGEVTCEGPPGQCP